MTSYDLPDCFDDLCGCPAGCAAQCAYIASQTLYVTNQFPTSGNPGLGWQPAPMDYDPDTATWFGYVPHYSLSFQAFDFLSYSMFCQQNRLVLNIGTPYGCYQTPNIGGPNPVSVSACNPFSGSVSSFGLGIGAAQVAVTPYGCTFPDMLFANVALNGTGTNNFPLAPLNGTYPIQRTGPLTWAGPIPGYQPGPSSTPTTAYILFGALLAPVVFSSLEPIVYGCTIAAYGQCIAFDVTSMGFLTCSPLRIPFNWINSHFAGPRGQHGSITIFH